MLSLKSVDLKKEKIESLVIPVCEDKNIHDDKIISSIVDTAKTVKAFNVEKEDEIVPLDENGELIDGRTYKWRTTGESA